MTGRHKSPTSPRLPLARGGVGSTPACDSTPGAGRATTAEVEGTVAGRRRGLPRRSWALVDGLGRFVREFGLLGLGLVGVVVWSVSLAGTALLVGGA